MKKKERKKKKTRNFNWSGVIKINQSPAITEIICSTVNVASFALQSHFHLLESIFHSALKCKCCIFYCKTEHQTFA